MEYTALIMDICNSTKIPLENRTTIQYFIKECLAALNTVFKNGLAKSVEFSGGDGVQGLFTSASASFLYARLYLMLLFPVSIRCGFGVGTWDVALDDSTNAQDGLAYHLARKAVDLAHDDSAKPMVLCSGNNEAYDINAMLLATCMLKKKQTARQNQYQLLLEMLSPLAVSAAFYESFPDLHSLILSNERRSFLSSLISNDRPGFDFVPDAPDIFRENYDPFVIGDIPADHWDYIDTGKKGYANVLAKATGVTRQNVEDALSKGGAYYVRDIDAAIALSLEKRHGGLAR